MSGAQWAPAFMLILFANSFMVTSKLSRNSTVLINNSKLKLIDRLHSIAHYEINNNSYYFKYRGAELGRDEDIPRPDRSYYRSQER